MVNNELILCIVNTGFSDTVMDAARDKGARGGTVIHARGTANKEAEEFFHITVQPDKEVVMIVVPTEIKDDVLHAIYQSAGLKTDGQGIAFSMPVTNVVGIAQSQDKQNPPPTAKEKAKKEKSDAHKEKAAEEKSEAATSQEEKADDKKPDDNSDEPKAE